jgi:hypothetical protein
MLYFDSDILTLEIISGAVQTQCELELPSKIIKFIKYFGWSLSPVSTNYYLVNDYMSCITSIMESIACYWMWTNSCGVILKTDSSVHWKGIYWLIVRIPHLVQIKMAICQWINFLVLDYFLTPSMYTLAICFYWKFADEFINTYSVSHLSHPSFINVWAGDVWFRSS